MFSPRHQAGPHPRPAKGRTGPRAFALLTLILSVALALASQPATATTSANDRGRAGTVAHTDQGTMTSRLVGRTAQGQKVTGTFTPLHVARRHGDLMVKGVIDGVVRNASGGTSTFTAVRSIPVKSIGGQHLGRSAAAAGSARAACDILHLVLGPLDLDLLGLQVHLNKVILDIVAATGAGNLLGNLLCAITGLLDGSPLAGLLGQISNLLNQILAALRLGV